MKKKRKIINRVLAAVLSLVLFFGTLDTTVFAAEEPAEVAQTGDTGSSTESGAGSGTWEGSITVTDGNDSYDVDLEGTQTDSTKQGTGEYTDSEGDKVSVSFEEKKEEYNPGDEGVVPIPDNAPTPEENGGVDSMPEPEEGGDITSSEPEEGGNTPSPTPEESTTPTAPVEGEEAASMASPENEGGAVPPAEPEGDGEAEPAPAATPDTSISVTVKPGTEEKPEVAEQEFTVNPGQILQRPECPEGYEESQDGLFVSQGESSEDIIEAGNKIGTETTSNGTWKVEQLPEDEGFGYKVTETKTITRVVEAVNPEKPDNAVEIEGGFQYPSEIELEDGTKVTATVKVILGADGKAVVTTIADVTRESIQKVTVDAKGKMTVVMYDVTAGAEQGNTPDGEEPRLSSFEIITPDNYNCFGYDEQNDLYNREGADGFAIIKTTASSLNIRNGKKDVIISSLPKGTYIQIFEEKDGWYRIGEDAWVSKTYAEIAGGTYQVTTSAGWVYDEPGKSGKSDKSRGKGSSVVVREIRKVNGINWAYIDSDGNGGGWIKMSNLSSNPVIGNPPSQTFAKEFSQKELKDLFTRDGYDYIYLGEKGLEGSIRVDLENGSNTWQAHQFILRDKDAKAYYVYCADLGTSAEDNFSYKLIPLDSVNNPDLPDSEIGHLSEEQLKHLKAIAQNGYWGVADNGNDKDLQSLKDKLKDAGFEEYDNITSGIALTATQAALWVYGTSDGKKVNENTDDWIKYLGNYFNNSSKKVTDVYNELKPEEKRALKAVFNWLIGKGDYTGKGATAVEAIKEEDFVITNTTVTVNKVVENTTVEKSADSISEVLDTNVSFAMQVIPSAKTDELMIRIFTVNGENEPVQVASFRLDDKDYYNSETGMYTVKGIQLPNGAKLRINLYGTQDLGKGIYVFKSDVDEKTGKSSQTFIGRSEENDIRKVDLSVTLSVNVTAAKATITKTTVAKGSYEIPEPPKPSNNPTPTPGNTPDPEDSPDPTPSETPGTRENPDPENTPDPDPVPSSEPVPTPVTVPDPEVPLARVTGRLVEITDGPVPLAARPNGLVEILDEEVPLAAVPLTGGISDIWYIVTAVAACSLLALLVKGRKKRKY